MGQLGNHKDKILVAVVLVPLAYLLFVISGAGSGVITFEPSESDPSDLNSPNFAPTGSDTSGTEPAEPRFPLNPEISWTWFYGILIGTVVVSLVILAILTLRRPRFGPDYHAPLETDPHEREFDELIHLLGQDSDPNRSIRLIFETAETKIEHLPKRIYPETPAEWSMRISARQPHLGAPLNQLCDSYAKSRFGDEPATAYDRDLALQALCQLRHLSDNIVVVTPKLPVLPWA